MILAPQTRLIIAQDGATVPIGNCPCDHLKPAIILERADGWKLAASRELAVPAWNLYPRQWIRVIRVQDERACDVRSRSAYEFELYLRGEIDMDENKKQRKTAARIDRPTANFLSAWLVSQHQEHCEKEPSFVSVARIMVEKTQTSTDPVVKPLARMDGRTCRDLAEAAGALWEPAAERRKRENREK
jgi:hypothetical protein